MPKLRHHPTDLRLFCELYNIRSNEQQSLTAKRLWSPHAITCGELARPFRGLYRCAKENGNIDAMNSGTAAIVSFDISGKAALLRLLSRIPQYKADNPLSSTSGAVQFDRTKSQLRGRQKCLYSKISGFLHEFVGPGEVRMRFMIYIVPIIRFVTVGTQNLPRAGFVTVANKVLAERRRNVSELAGCKLRRMRSCHVAASLSSRVRRSQTPAILQPL